MVSLWTKAVRLLTNVYMVSLWTRVVRLLTKMLHALVASKWVMLEDKTVTATS